MEALIRGLDPHARVSRAITQDKTYTGPIVAQNTRFIAQEVGRHEFVLHEQRAFERAPEHAERATIRYHAGNAKVQVQAAKARPGRGSR